MLNRLGCAGQLRGSFGKPAHQAMVKGVAADAVNRRVVTAAADGEIKFWVFKSGKHEGTVGAPGPRVAAAVAVALPVAGGARLSDDE